VWISGICRPWWVFFQGVVSPSECSFPRGRNSLSPISTSAASFVGAQIRGSRNSLGFPPAPARRSVEVSRRLRGDPLLPRHHAGPVDLRALSRHRSRQGVLLASIMPSRPPAHPRPAVSTLSRHAPAMARCLSPRSGTRSHSSPARRWPTALAHWKMSKNGTPRSPRAACMRPHLHLHPCLPSVGLAKEGSSVVAWSDLRRAPRPPRTDFFVFLSRDLLQHAAIFCNQPGVALQPAGRNREQPPTPLPPLRAIPQSALEGRPPCRPVRCRAGSPVAPRFEGSGDRPDRPPPAGSM